MLFSPVMLEGKRLNQGDTQNNIGMAKEARRATAREGEVPHWTDSMFGGMPTTQITGTDIATAPWWTWMAIRKVIPIEVGTIVVAMLSAYVLGLCLGLSPWLSLLLGLGFGLVEFERPVPVCRPRHQGAGHRHHARRVGGGRLGVPGAHVGR